MANTSSFLWSLHQASGSNYSKIRKPKEGVITIKPALPVPRPGRDRETEEKPILFKEI